MGHVEHWVHFWWWYLLPAREWIYIQDAFLGIEEHARLCLGDGVVQRTKSHLYCLKTFPIWCKFLRIRNGRRWDSGRHHCRDIKELASINIKFNYLRPSIIIPFVAGLTTIKSPCRQTPGVRYLAVNILGMEQRTNQDTCWNMFLWAFRQSHHPRIQGVVKGGGEYIQAHRVDQCVQCWFHQGRILQPSFQGLWLESLQSDHRIGINPNEGRFVVNLPPA